MSNDYIGRLNDLLSKTVVTGYGGNRKSRTVLDEYNFIVCHINTRKSSEPVQWWQGDYEAVVQEYHLR